MAATEQHSRKKKHEWTEDDFKVGDAQDSGTEKESGGEETSKQPAEGTRVETLQLL